MCNTLKKVSKNDVGLGEQQSKRTQASDPDLGDQNN